MLDALGDGSRFIHEGASSGYDFSAHLKFVSLPSQSMLMTIKDPVKATPGSFKAITDIETAAWRQANVLPKNYLHTMDQSPEVDRRLGWWEAALVLTIANNESRDIFITNSSNEKISAFSHVLYHPQESTLVPNFEYKKPVQVFLTVDPSSDRLLHERTHIEYITKQAQTKGADALVRWLHKNDTQARDIAKELGFKPTTHEKMGGIPEKFESNPETPIILYAKPLSVDVQKD
jgi:hypothetical protein